jgi:hypothetical protein
MITTNLHRSLLFEPNLLKGKVKPVGRLTYSNDCRPDIYGYFPLTINHRGDLSKNLKVSSSPGITYSERGAGFDNAAGTKIQLASPFSFPDNEATVIFSYRSNSTTTDSINDGILSDKNVANWTTTAGFSVNIRSDGGILLKVGTSETYTNTNYWKDGLTHIGIVRYKQGVNSTIHVDESEVSYTAQNTGPAYVKGVQDARIGTYYDEAANRTANGDIGFVIILDSHVSISSAIEISRNPYRFVVPEGNFYYPAPVVVGGATIPVLLKDMNGGFSRMRGGFING